MIYRGRIKGGMIVLDDPEAKIPEGTPVNVETLPAQAEGDLLDDPFYRIDELAVETGIPDPSTRLNQSEVLDRLFTMGDLATETGVPDLAANIDHYLYGYPRVEDGGEA
jgi:hypothetical protein